MSLGALAVRHDASSAALVRHSIADDLAGNAIARESIDDVVLVASELVGNAVVHTAADPADSAKPLSVSWELEPGAVVVRVADGSGDPPVRRRPGVGNTGGRGLAIVAAIASDWGVHRGERGKQVWARVPVQRA
jgi:anti-sigma regulatory factor (Ser/Thr protein kinase)